MSDLNLIGKLLVIADDLQNNLLNEDHKIVREAVALINAQRAEKRADDGISEYYMMLSKIADEPRIDLG